MNNDLMLFAIGDIAPRKGDRAIAARAKAIYDEVREKDLMARGAFALAADIMDGANALDDKAERMAGDNPRKQRILGEIELNAIRQTMRIQNSLYDPFGF